MSGASGERLLDAVRRARAEGRRVMITGSGSKSPLTRTPAGDGDGRLLSTVEHVGVVDYQPQELVITARTGTPLRELRQVLAREGQMLAFEPPEFRGLGTLGGAVASGLAGPGRPWRGGVRDSLLGVVMVNGLGERLRFGGQVMKNVAGFDVSRLQAGAWGTLGLLLEVSLRVVPAPHHEETRVLEMGREAALAWMRRCAATPLPATATAWVDGLLHVRLSGAEPAVLAAAGTVGGEVSRDASFWPALRDHSHPYFREAVPACRHLPPAAPLAAADELLEWNGARRWTLREETDASLGFRPFGPGYARLRCTGAGGDALLAGYQQRLREAFDPDGLFNPVLGRADLAA